MKQTKKQARNKDGLFPVFLRCKLKNYNRKPIILIERTTSEPDHIKSIIEAAMFEKPIIVYPTFRNKFFAINKLLDVGIIKYCKDKNEYEFLI